jgi:hypothetical protein
MTLNATQIADLLSRNGTLAGLVTNYNAEGLYFQYLNQVSSNIVDPTTVLYLDWLSSGVVATPIPAYGLEINDPTYGYVEVFPMSDGTLTYNTSTMSNPSAQPVPTGGQGSTMSSIVTGITNALPNANQLTGTLNLGLILGIVVVGYLLLRETR